MSQFISFRNCLVSVGSVQVFATSADLSIDTSLEKDVRFIDYDQGILGASINSPVMVPTEGVKGTLSIEFIISKQHFEYDETKNENTIATIFELNKQTSTQLEKIGRIGNYRFYNIALSRFGFSMKPFDLIRASAEYEIFGSIVQVSTSPETTDNINPAEGLKSFGDIKANGINLQDSSRFNIQLLSADYSVQAQRKYNFTIRANEHPVTQYTPGAIMPYRVSLSDLSIETSVESNKIIPAINEAGRMQHGFEGSDFSDIEIELNLFEAKNESSTNETGHLAKFGCVGQVTSQSLSASDGSYLTGDFTVKQVLK